MFDGCFLVLDISLGKPFDIFIGDDKHRFARFLVVQFFSCLLIFECISLSVGDEILQILVSEFQLGIFFSELSQLLIYLVVLPNCLNCGNSDIYKENGSGGH